MYTRPTRWRAFFALAVFVVGCGGVHSAPHSERAVVDAVDAKSGADAPTGAVAAAAERALEEPAFRLNPIGTDPPKSINVLRLSSAELQAFDKLSSDRRAEVLRVYVAVAGTGGDFVNTDLPPILGTYAIVDEALRFTPRFPFARGLRYRITLNRAPLSGESSPRAEEVTFFFETAPAPAQPPTEVVHVYPSGGELPENQLKFYLHFSGPMSRGQAYRRIHLLDAQGQELQAVFLELGEELWDPAMRRFTLLCDPGRVKRGLVPREELGPVLEAGQDYTLVIDKDWLDANGQQLASAARKSFHVLPPDEVPIDLTTWKITAPPADTRDPLVVRFPESLDHALLNRMLSVRNSTGSATIGTVDISDGETCWQFTPSEPWTAGDYRLVVDTALEDLAGNAVGRAFDVDTFGPIQNRIETATAEMPFSIPPAH